VPELDGVRGLAILLVITLHYVSEIAHFRLSYLVRLSWSGVDLFFVLSGFLIGGILLDAKESPRYFQTFYLRRLYRILPLYLLFIAIFVAGTYRVGSDSPPALREIFNRDIPLWSFPLFLQNFFFVLRHTYGSTWMATSWSLAVEEQFYLLLPFLIRRLSTRHLTRFLVGAVVFAPVLRIVLQQFGDYGLACYTMLPCRADSLGCGVLIALAARDRTVWQWLCTHRRYIYTCFLIFSVGAALWTVRDFWLMAQIGYSWMAGLYASLLLLVLAKPSRIEQFVFRNWVLVKLGTVAYAVYLFHAGILRLYHCWWFGALPSVHNLATLGVTALALVTVLILAGASWRALESPLLQYARRRYRY